MTTDGRYVLFESVATDLLAGFVNNNATLEDLFLWDRKNDAIHVVSRGALGELAGADGQVLLGSLAQKAPRATFNSDAQNHITGFDDNNASDSDVFVYTLP